MKKALLGFLTVAALFLARGMSQTASLTTPTTSLLPGGGTVTFTATATYSTSLSALGWSVAIPPGWAYVSGTNEPDIRPSAGRLDTLEWAYITVPANSATFTFTVSYPAGVSDLATITPSVLVRTASNGSNGGSSSTTITPTPVQVQGTADSSAAIPTVTSAATATGTYGAPFSYTIVATSTTPITSFSAAPLPDGLSVNSLSGEITGTPTQAGSFTVSLGATNSTGTGAKTLTITIAKASQVITFPAIAPMAPGTTVTLGATSSSGMAVSYSVLSGPGSISGASLTATAAGTITVRATQSGSPFYLAAAKDLSIDVRTPGGTGNPGGGTDNPGGGTSKQSQTITFSLSAATYGDLPRALNATASSGLPVSYRVVSGPATVSGTTLTFTGAGTVIVEASQLGDTVYAAATAVQSSVTIAKAQLTAIAGDARRFVGEPNPTFTLSYSGFVGSDSENSIATPPQASTQATVDSPAGTYSIVLAGGVSANYTFQYLFGTLTVESGPVTPSITAALSNISIRGIAGKDAQTLIVGCVTSPGTVAQTTDMRALIRGVGPSLVPFGIAEMTVLANPKLSLYWSADNSLVRSATTWGGDPMVAEATDVTGAFPLDPASKDAAIVQHLAPGAYTTHVTGADGSSGITLVECYAVDQEGRRFVNLSTRTQVGVGANVLIAGFVITGTGSKTVLIRGVGAILETFGLPKDSVLQDPKITLYSGESIIATNDNWQGSADIKSAAKAVGAFELPDTSKDAALLVTLIPGAYTVHVAGVNDSTGVALFELYEVQ